MPTTYKALVYHQIPEGFPEIGKHISVDELSIDIDAPLKDGYVLLKVLYASFDPYQRPRMRDVKIKSYSPAYEPGKPINNFAIAEVIKSASSNFKVGEIIDAPTIETAQYSLLHEGYLAQANRIENKNNLPLNTYLGPLGMTGMTAYEGLYDVGKAKKGETIFISSAAGAVGQVVGQLAKQEGLTVIGSVGSDEKLEYIKSIGFDSGFNYKKEKPADALKRLAPEGIDIYFENVGGEHLIAALGALKKYGRVVACGMITAYNNGPDNVPIPNLMHVVSKCLTIQGFLVDFGKDTFTKRRPIIEKMLVDGRIKANLDETTGIDNAAEGFLKVFRGTNFGKAILKL